MGDINNLPVKQLLDLKDIEWFTNPTKYSYLRESEFNCLKSEYSLVKRRIKHLIGIEKRPENLDSDTIISCKFYYLKSHDIDFHPNHVCCNSYCGNGLAPSEAVKIKGEWNHLLEYLRNKPKIILRVKSVLNQRHKVFVRDNYRCLECGATNKDTRLNVDHIIPRSKGGSNDLSNLQTLCWECNIGKSDSIWEKE